MYMDGPDSYIYLYDFEEKKGFIKHNGIGMFFSFQNQSIVPDNWQHVCMAAMDNGNTTLVLNGKIIYEGFLKRTSNKFETNLWIGGSTKNLWYQQRRFEGVITDIYLWNEFINIDDLILITTNRKRSHSILAPTLFSWKTYKTTRSCECIEYQTLDENDKLFKDSFKEGAIILIEHKASFDSANQFCKGFGGKFLVPQNSNEVDFVYSLIKKSNKCHKPATFVGLLKINSTMLVDVNGDIAPYVHWND